MLELNFAKYEDLTKLEDRYRALTLFRSIILNVNSFLKIFHNKTLKIAALGIKEGEFLLTMGIASWKWWSGVDVVLGKSRLNALSPS